MALPNQSSKSPKKRQPPQPSFEEALEQLEKIVHDLEDGGIGLNEALAGYEKGVRLLRQCHLLLEKAERRIELLSGVNANGDPITRPLDDSAPSLDEKARRNRRGDVPQCPPPPESGAPKVEDETDGPPGLF